MPILGASSSGAKPAPTVPTSTSAANVGTGRAYNNGSATVSFSAPTTSKLPVTSYTATSSPGSFTATGASSPLTVTGLQSGTAYVFTVTATSASGTSDPSAASGIITATTVPQAPTVGTAIDGGTGTTVSVPFTANATGGSSITGYTVTSSPGSITGTGASSPITVSGLTSGTAYTFTVTATNANGTSAASSASNSVTPTVPSSFESIATANPSGTSSVTFSNIPQTYKSLHIRGVATASSGNGYSLWIQYNSITTDYSYNILRGNGTTKSNNSSTNIEKIYMEPGDQPAFNYPGVFYFDIVDYASSTKKKTLQGKWGTRSSIAGGIDLFSGANWTSTAAITSITLITSGGNLFSTNSKVALYGVK